MKKGGIAPNTFWRDCDFKSGATLPPGLFNPFCLPPCTRAALLCYSRSPNRQTLAEQLDEPRATINFTLALNRLGSRIRLRARLNLVPSKRAFSYPIFNVVHSASCQALSSVGHHRKGKPNQVKPNIPSSRLSQSLLLSGIYKLWQIKQAFRCVTSKL